MLKSFSKCIAQILIFHHSKETPTIEYYYTRGSAPVSETISSIDISYLLLDIIKINH